MDNFGISSHLAGQVVIRVRPPLPREVEGERMFQNIVSVDKEEHVITISENLNAVLDEVGRWVRLVWNGGKFVLANFRAVWT